MSCVPTGHQMHAVCQRAGCGKPFTYIRTPGRPPAFCSPECREATNIENRKAHKQRAKARRAKP